MVETLPLFPLGTVLLPGASLPLHVFEPRYRQLTIDLVTGAVPGKQFGVVAVREGWSPDEGVDGLHPIGCTANLREVRRLPDGRFDILTQGDRRFRLLEVSDSAAPYLVGTVDWLPDEPADRPGDIDLLELAARAAHRRYCTTAWRRGDGGGEDGDEDGDEDGGGDEGGDEGGAPEPVQEETADVDAAELAHVLAADCLLPLADRQELLEQTCPARRLRMVRQFMVREAELLDRLHAVWAPTAKFAVEHSHN